MSENPVRDLAIAAMAVASIVGLILHPSWGMLGLTVVLVLVVVATFEARRTGQDPDELVPRVSRWVALKRRERAQKNGSTANPQPDE